ncbi:predicted protein [Thalassiosira pseudonana CCMP1335]|uniref:Uncharacterized protein n=1 Tax=Thalassiosira pseudonana TaxID=35128 RepID=B8CC47_THAPS|nr:predicted protein [Thalassiosira pseudonana CCMP1335]EED88707.1 predicted protein [Thalassiosira pseudonana CCMP1335]
MTLFILLLLLSPLIHAFVPAVRRPTLISGVTVGRGVLDMSKISLMAKKPEQQRVSIINQKRRQQLGISDEEDEYDLDVALNANTDAGITKIIAGSFILVMIALLVVGLVIPSLTDYGEGVCSPIQSGGRC